jgi:hypothetical protein
LLKSKRKIVKIKKENEILIPQVLRNARFERLQEDKPQPLPQSSTECLCCLEAGREGELVGTREEVETR